jgi:hypothetical protein
MKALMLVALTALCACAHRPWEEPGPSWKRVASEHFVVNTDAAGAAYGPVIDRLEDVYTALSQTFFRGVEVPPVQVLLLEKARDFHALVDSKPAGVFLSEVGDGGVLVFPTEAENFDHVASIAAHELVHRFMHALNPAVPAWLNEGFAMYVDALEVKDDLVVFDAGPIPRGYTYFSAPVPFRTLFAATERAYHSRAADAYYMTSWMLVRHLLSETGPGALDRFRTLVTQSVARLPEERAAAVQAAMGGLSIAEIEAQVLSTHRRAFWGVAQARTRSSLAVTLRRPPRPALFIEAANTAEVRALCRGVRQAWGHAVSPSPKPVPDPRERCFVGHRRASENAVGGNPAPDASPATPSGLAKEVVARIIRGHAAEVRGCYEQHTLRWSGRVLARFTIAPGGNVAQSQIESTTLESPEAEACIGRAICRWTFPKPANGVPVVVAFPWRFERSPGEAAQGSRP